MDQDPVAQRGGVFGSLADCTLPPTIPNLLAKSYTLPRLNAEEQPWLWSKTWWLNEVAWIQFLLPIAFALNIPLSFRAIVQTAGRECRSLRGTWDSFRQAVKGTLRLPGYLS